MNLGDALFIALFPAKFLVRRVFTACVKIFASGDCGGVWGLGVPAIG